MNKYFTATVPGRRDEILRLVTGQPIRSQSELARLLQARGFSVAQATLSRDIRELGIVKGPSGYLPPDAGAAAPVPFTAGAGAAGRLARTVADFVLSVERAGTLVVLRTVPAAAQAVAIAIDKAALDGAAGTIAGDDTVFIAARGTTAAGEVTRRLLSSLRPAGAARRMT